MLYNDLSPNINEITRGKSSSCNRVEFSQPIQLPKKKLKESD